MTPEWQTYRWKDFYEWESLEQSKKQTFITNVEK